MISIVFAPIRLAMKRARGARAVGLNVFARAECPAVRGQHARGVVSLLLRTSHGRGV
jgi:hypothetical protein